MSTTLVRSFIDGEFKSAADGRSRELVDPATGEPFARAEIGGEADVEAAMAAASRAFDTWRAATPSERSLALYRIADAIEARADELVEAECRNTGKPIALTRSEEVGPMVDQIRFFAGAARNLEGRASAEYVAGLTSFIRREPIGVCAQITPWNYPMMMASLTGSVRAGIEVARDAADDVKRVHLELGGKAPVVVFADCDVPAAIEAIATAGYFNAGQDCTAATRVLVARELHDEFVERLAAHAAELSVGPPSDTGAFYGPLNSAAQLEAVSGFIDRLPGHARVVTGGVRVGDVGYFFAPTVVAGVKADDEIACQEVFGPVITVQPFDSEAEAISLANGVEYGLASSVFTSDHGTAMRVAGALDFGCVWINTHIPLAAEMPHGGYKRSGYGKDLSMYGFEDYTRIKHVMSNITV